MSDEPRKSEPAAEVEGHLQADQDRAHSPVEDVAERSRRNEDDVPEVEGHYMRGVSERAHGQVDRQR